MKPQISIILPSYSGEKTINKTISSIFLQTYTNFELLISVYKKKKI
jgi:glycosyltransferase involved in cell wall biosynthesis